MRIIFLDIDGVLTSVRTGWYNFDLHATNFIRWVCDKSNAKIVISSTWRHNHNKEFWKTIFEDYLHDDYKTPDLVQQRSSGLLIAKTRGSEIQAWLDNHSEVDRYAILDDDKDMLEHQQPFLIQTDSMNGMLDIHMMRLRNHFKITEYPKEQKELFQHPNMFMHTRKK